MHSRNDIYGKPSYSFEYLVSMKWDFGGNESLFFSFFVHLTAKFFANWNLLPLKYPNLWYWWHSHNFYLSATFWILSKSFSSPLVRAENHTTHDCSAINLMHRQYMLIIFITGIRRSLHFWVLSFFYSIYSLDLLCLHAILNHQ